MKMTMPLLIRRTASAGFSLVSAIFLIVVLAGLGAAMMFISTMQHQSSALDVQGVRAYQAARAGIEWGLYQRLRVLNNAACFSNKNLSFAAGTSLRPFSVTVTCQPNSNIAGINAAIITAVACNMPNGTGTCAQGQTSNSPDFILRVIEVRL